MTVDINQETILKSGDWVIRKGTENIYKLVETEKPDVFEIRPKGINTTYRDGVTFVGDRNELIKNYQKITL